MANGTSTPPSWFTRVKDVVLFVGGFVGMGWEAVLATEPRAILVGAYLLALGLPVFSGFDRLFQRSTDLSSPTPSTTPTPAAARDSEQGPR